MPPRLQLLQDDGLGANGPLTLPHAKLLYVVHMLPFKSLLPSGATFPQVAHWVSGIQHQQRISVFCDDDESEGAQISECWRGTW